MTNIQTLISKILTNILTALYQPFWFSLLTAILLMVLYLYAKEKSGDGSCIDKNTGSSGNCVGEETGGHVANTDASFIIGLKTVACIWKHEFLTSATFRRLFCLAFYTVMILFRTLLNRNLWLNPLSDVMGGWTLTDANGELTTEPIENLMLFVPFSVLLLWAVFNDEGMKERRLHGKNARNGKTTLISTLWLSTKTVFLFSLSIEFLQLFLRLGTVTGREK